MNRLKQWLVWIKRITHCRGFGIQNPDDYFFVRYVVNEHWPFHAYSQLARHTDSLTAKLGKFYLRLANHLQPNDVIDLAGMGDYFKAGCHKATIHSTMPAQNQKEGDKAIFVVDALEYDNSILQYCSKRTVLVIHRLWKQKRLWAAISSNKEVTTGFNLYYCAVFFFCPRISRQHYIVNF